MDCLFIYCLKGPDWNPAFRELLGEGLLACGLGALAHGGVYSSSVIKATRGAEGHR